MGYWLEFGDNKAIIKSTELQGAEGCGGVRTEDFVASGAHQPECVTLNNFRAPGYGAPRSSEHSRYTEVFLH